MSIVDRLFNVKVADVRGAVMRSVYRSTNEAAVNFVAATAMLLILLCDRHDISVVRVLSAANNMLRMSRDKFPVETRALRRYVREELPDA